MIARGLDRPRLGQHDPHDRNRQHDAQPPQGPHLLPHDVLAGYRRGQQHVQRLAGALRDERADALNAEHQHGQRPVKEKQHGQPRGVFPPIAQHGHGSRNDQDGQTDHQQDPHLVTGLAQRAPVQLPPCDRLPLGQGGLVPDEHDAAGQAVRPVPEHVKPPEEAGDDAPAQHEGASHQENPRHHQEERRAERYRDAASKEVGDVARLVEDERGEDHQRTRII
jgi:hypothetical protein